ncbi:metallophosphoesterase family protein [Prosthecobacter sp.]|uniref:metallophosphoesterase family protein n=1 Tax=Prosthecobacter sp. TaxID=1965333 RepID=UPI0024886535|nr:metallophosphoesterase family protein [Prosthecobacter sp.]MDI1315142.1 metallophosphoesterase family protein [Prosthecobacter sp.]
MNNNLAIISDIHGNLQALEAVVADIRSQGISDCICLGDIVGYGGSPAECIDLVRDFCSLSLMGNHDHYVSSTTDIQDVSDEVRQVVDWTRHHLSAERLSWLGTLPMHFDGGDIEAVHASLHKPDDWPYMLQAGDATQHFKHQVKPVCFIGHTHQPEMWVEGEDQAVNTTSVESLRPDLKQVINVGSVGQPRDKDERACYLIYRRGHQDVWWRRVPYDIAGAQRAITAAGLPAKHAARLEKGK